MERKARIERKTRETTITLDLVIDGRGDARVSTGIGMLDHLICQIARHGRMDVALACEGDVEVDDHHSAEDCALVLGAGLDEALGDRRGIARFGWACAPLDEALARAVVDLSGRPHAEVDLDLGREALGGLACENVTHFVRSLAVASRATIHVDVLRGENDHHRAEAAFKAVALALRQAAARDGSDEVPSTKGVL